MGTNEILSLNLTNNIPVPTIFLGGCILGGQIILWNFLLYCELYLTVEKGNPENQDMIYVSGL